jgi:hypothetical protein
MHPIPRFLLLIATCVVAAGAADQPGGGPLVEQSATLERGRGLGTAGYRPTASELPFAKRVTEKGIDLSPALEMPKATDMSDAEWEQMKAAMKAEKAKLIPVTDYTLAGQAGDYVAWFGIVRSITRDAATQRSTLVIQHLYFDGLTDLHLQVVSYYGAGDFTTVVPAQAPGIARLALVRCYGRVGKGAGEVPAVAADYLRTWAWGQFTFMDYGVDKSNPAWVALRQVKGEDAYSSRPDREFYLKRLGAPE